VLLAEFQTTFFYSMVIGLNASLCLDLILTLRDPFSAPDSRYNVYLLVSVLGAFPAAFIRSKAYNIYIYGWIVVVVFVGYLISAIVSAIYAVRRLKHPGISSEARQMFARRHLSYIFVNIICQAYNIISKINASTENKPMDGWFFTVLSVLFFGQGFFLSLVRFFEPSYLPTLAQLLKNTFCPDK